MVVTVAVPDVVDVPSVAVRVAAPAVLLGVYVTVIDPEEPVNADVGDSDPACALSTRGTPTSPAPAPPRATVKERGAEPATKLVTDAGDHVTVVPDWTSYSLKLGPA